MGLNKFSFIIVVIIAIYMASPYGRNLSHPEAYGLKCSRTLSLSYGDKVVDETIDIGAWHITPGSSVPSCVFNPQNNRTSIEDDMAFADNRPIIFYVHGNGGTRGGEHRSKLYRKFAYDFNYHVITFDYRGYGDSTNLKPTADGVTSDTRFVYDWLLKQKNVTLDRVTVWGHSLGTAIATRMVSQLPTDKQPERLVLEAPFDSVGSAIRDHPFSAPFRLIPYFEYFFIDPIVNSPELNFDSSKSIAGLKTTQVLILHAEDDGILPISLGRKLYKEAKAKLGNKVNLIEINKSFGLGHKLICLHHETMEKIYLRAGAPNAMQSFEV